MSNNNTKPKFGRRRRRGQLHQADDYRRDPGISARRPIRYENLGRDARNYRVDFAKIRAVLDFQPRTTVRDGIAELIKALDEHRVDDVDTRPNFHGNYEIDYPVAS